MKKPKNGICPNNCCKNSNNSEKIVKSGFYRRRSDGKKVQRFQCKNCGKSFSKATGTREFGFKIRREIPLIYKFYASNVSIRRIALNLNINRGTVVRKIKYLALRAREENMRRLEILRQNPVQEVQFDDLITIEHTKMKPLSVSIAVDKTTREILGMKVARIPAFGLLAAKSRKKYGRRVNQHPQKLNELFNEIQFSIHPRAIFQSDEHWLYPSMVKKYFPEGEHLRYKGGRSCVAGQGELKRKHFDPIFSLNHSCAMLRANLNRLIRKTWCTTKDPQMLEMHLQIYQKYHNQVLLKVP